MKAKKITYQNSENEEIKGHDTVVYCEEKSNPDYEIWIGQKVVMIVWDKASVFGPTTIIDKALEDETSVSNVDASEGFDLVSEAVEEPKDTCPDVPNWNLIFWYAENHPGVDTGYQVNPSDSDLKLFEDYMAEYEDGDAAKYQITL